MAAKKTEPVAETHKLTDQQMLAQMEARAKARRAAVVRCFLEQGLVPVARVQLPGCLIILNPTLGEMTPQDRAELTAQLETLEK
jgi:hypothetical protein